MIPTEKQENLFDLIFGNQLWINEISTGNLAVPSLYLPVSISLS